ncbi:PfkB family carbohydrate kinase [Salibacteraceae bacterium]|nr:PfkB family carbohydrate kinase [Salibacteraceae bacterium]MDB9708682.1 PfkB family carbohydrate kinase [Salibacteraceae bacterium]MDC1220191.1 PfkB family carbohydrate kinase [bacterium]
MSTVVVGTMAFDSLETPFGKAERIVGGAATYIGLSASYLAKNIQMVSVIGEDFPQEFITDLKSRGLRLDGVEMKKGEKSFYWSGKYHNDMNTRDTLDTQLNVLADFEPNVPAEDRNADFLMLGNLTPAVQMSVIDQMTSRPKLVVLDTMNFWMEIALDDLKKVLKKVDVVTINDEEARILSGEYSLVKAARKILKMGPKYLIIKKGEHGALLFNNEEVFFAPALPLEEVFDPTGAGDTFAGGFIGFLARSEDISFENMKRAIIYGSAMASFCVEKFGTERLQNLTQNEIDNRVQQFIDLTQVEIKF